MISNHAHPTNTNIYVHVFEQHARVRLCLRIKELPGWAADRWFSSTAN